MKTIQWLDYRIGYTTHHREDGIGIEINELHVPWVLGLRHRETYARDAEIGDPVIAFVVRQPTPEQIEELIGRPAAHIYEAVLAKVCAEVRALQLREEHLAEGAQDLDQDPRIIVGDEPDPLDDDSEPAHGDDGDDFEPDPNAVSWQERMELDARTKQRGY